MGGGRQDWRGHDWGGGVIGRRHEQARLEALLTADRSVTAFLSGPAGVGRSSLGRWWVERAVDTGALVVTRSPNRSSTDAWWHGLHELPADGARALPLIPNRHRRAAPDVGEVLRRHAGGRRVVVWIDDLEALCDPELLAFAEAAHAPPWDVLLAAVCPSRLRDIGRDVVRSLIADEVATAVLVGPLDVAAATTLVVERVGDSAALAPGRVRWLVQRERGIPSRLRAAAAEMVPQKHATRYERAHLESALGAVRELQATSVDRSPMALAGRRGRPTQFRVAVLGGWAELEAGQARAALATADGILRASRQVGDVGGAAHAQTLAAVALADSGEATAARQRLQRAAAAVRNRPRLTSVAQCGAAHALLLCGDATAAARHATAALDALGAAPLGADHLRAAVLLGWSSWRCGRVQEAARWVRAAAALDDVAPLAAHYRAALECLLAAELGQEELSRMLAARLFATDIGRMRPATAAWTAWAAGRAYANSRSPDLGRRWLRWAWHTHAEHDSVAGELVALPDLVEVELACGHVDEARRLSDRLARLVDASPAPLHVELAARSHALVLIGSGSPRAALDRLTAATSIDAASPVERSRTLRVAAMSARAIGDHVQAWSVLSDAVDIARQAGAIAEARRCERALERPHQPVRESISDREHEVCALVAEGMTNREIGERLHISHRTVEHHIASVLQKLGLSNRTRLASWLAAGNAQREARV
jgi:DNA-binding NarL/FixJ family response regulator